MMLQELENKKILLVGYGVEGKATHEFLKKRFPNTMIGITDKAIDGENYLDKQKDYDIAIKSPGIHKSKMTIPYTTAANIFFANVKGTTIGVTGSKGKSTTTALIYHMLKSASKKVFLLGNITHKLSDIGKPLLAELDHRHGEDVIYVCELSSHQLDDLHYSPHIAVFTSFFPEHMDFHGSIEQYWQAKTHITSDQTEKDFFIYNPRFKKIGELAKTTKAKAIPFVATLPFSAKDIPLIGEHNMQNVKGAVTTVKVIGISDKEIEKAIKTFQPLPHRLENIGTYQGITFIDDSISTTPDSTIQAIKALPKTQTIFLGGLDRGYDFSELAATIISSNIQNLILFPESGEKILQTIQKQTTKMYKTFETIDMQQAVQFAYANTTKGHIALLSSAAPSFTIWKNFEEKGNLFKEAVKEYA